MIKPFRYIKRSGKKLFNFWIKTTFVGAFKFVVVKSGAPLVWSPGDGGGNVVGNTFSKTYTNNTERMISTIISDTSQVTELRCVSEGDNSGRLELTDMVDIAYAFPNLIRFDMQYHGSTKIKPNPSNPQPLGFRFDIGKLATLRKLRVINVHGCGAAFSGDVTRLAELPDLEFIHIDDNPSITGNVTYLGSYPKKFGILTTTSDNRPFDMEKSPRLTGDVSQWDSLGSVVRIKFASNPLLTYGTAKGARTWVSATTIEANGCGWSSEMVDRFLVDLDNRVNPVKTTIIVASGNASPGATGSSAKTSLIAKGMSVN